MARWRIIILLWVFKRSDWFWFCNSFSWYCSNLVNQIWDIGTSYCYYSVHCTIPRVIGKIIPSRENYLTKFHETLNNTKIQNVHIIFIKQNRRLLSWKNSINTSNEKGWSFQLTWRKKKKLLLILLSTQNPSNIKLKINKKILHSKLNNSPSNPQHSLISPRSWIVQTVKTGIPTFNQHSVDIHLNLLPK